MNFGEVLEYGMIGVGCLIGGPSVFLTALAGIQFLGNLFSEKIRSQQQLDRITSEEAEKLGMQGLINPIFYDTFRASTNLLLEGDHEIHVGGFGANRATVRHEIYHAYRGHNESALRLRKRNSILNDLDYLFRREPQAVVYSIFGLKL